MDAHFNELTGVEDEALAITSEEAGEILQVLGRIIQVAGKINRHGLESKNPYDPDSLTNRESLEVELADMLASIELLAIAGVIRRERLSELKNKKLLKLPRFLHHIDLSQS